MLRDNLPLVKLISDIFQTNKQTPINDVHMSQA